MVIFLFCCSSEFSDVHLKSFRLFLVAFCTVYKILFPNYSKRIYRKSELQWEFFP